MTILAVLPLGSAGQEAEVIPEPATRREDDARLLPLPKLTVKSADIHGQVYIAGERQGEEEEPAKNVVVQVRTPETGDTLREARTDDDGRYTFERLEPGIYYFIIGSLRMNLIVEPGGLAAGELPKIILVVLPRDMTQFQP